MTQTSQIKSRINYIRHHVRYSFIIAALLLLTTPSLNNAIAGTCLTGDCHNGLTDQRYLHGPVAAEQAGAMGCIACHFPTEKKCTKTEKGVFKELAKSTIMCQTCHAKGTDSLHSAKDLDCLECHDPHGSNTSPIFKR